MKYLLDTHIWLWGSIQPDRLSSRVTKALDDPQNDLWLSPVGIWNYLSCAAKGVSHCARTLQAGLRKTSRTHALERLTIDVALAIPSINFSHGDPADQFLAATAKVFNLTLITGDEHLLTLPGIRVLANRRP